MKPAAVRSSSFLVLALVLSLPFASRGEEVRSSDGGGRPYLFGEESFREWTRTPYGRFSVLERFDHELLGVPVGNYRVAVLEVAPRAFLQPRHYDADAILYVMEGEGVVALLRGGKRESFCVREGDVMVIPAGSIVYSANTHQARWLRAMVLFIPVSTPGRFQEFFPFGGQGQESFFSAFSNEVLQAAFNASREELERQKQGVIYQASEEQIRALSRSCSRGRDGDEELKPCSLPTQRPRYSNNHGTMHVLTSDECHQLRDLDIEVGFANMNPGSMMAPTYTTRSTRITLVAEGSGYFEIAVQFQSELGGEEQEEVKEEQKKSREYRQVRGQMKEGSVVVLPAGHPATFVARKNLAVVFFGVGTNHDEQVFLAGGNSLLKQLDGPAEALVFGDQGKEAADMAFSAQRESVFLLHDGTDML